MKVMWIVLTAMSLLFAGCGELPIGDATTTIIPSTAATPTLAPGDDTDGDGVKNYLDCDPRNPLNYPGNEEVCDQRDNDCDCTSDEELPAYLFCIDQDGDGYAGLKATAHCEPEPPEGLVYCDDQDCDDQDAEANPSQLEIAGDEKDNDCDGAVDENTKTR